MILSYTLRDYQDKAVNAVIKALVELPQVATIVAEPMGTGKSLIIAGVIQRVLWYWPQKRFVMATHSRHLVSQNAEKMAAMLPNANVGLYSAGLNQKDLGHQITFGNIQSMYKSPELFGVIDVLIIDEAHLVGEKESSMYLSFIDVLRKLNPNLKIIGLTATAFRPGMGKLTEGRIFNHTSIDQTHLEGFNWFIEQGYLTMLIPRPMGTTLDVEDVKITNGDFNQKQLQKAVNKEEVTFSAVQEMAQFGHERNSWLCFGSGINHVESITEMLLSQGIEAGCVHSKKSNDGNDAILAKFENRDLQCVVNNGILVTGYDNPMIDLIGLFNPTRVTAKHVQLLGRGTRPVYAEGFDLTTQQGRLDAIAAGPKPNCLVLDFAGNIPRLGPINDPQIPKKKNSKQTGEIPIKICGPDKLEEGTGMWPEGCGAYNHTTSKECCQCKGLFIFRSDLQANAGSNEIIATGKKHAKIEPILEWFNVDNVTYYPNKRGKIPSMKVAYHCGVRTFYDYICLDHGKYPAKCARDWWRGRTNGSIPPESTSKGFDRIHELRTPARIQVDVARPRYNVLMGEGFT